MTLVKRNGSLLNQMPVLFDDLFNRDLFNWGNQNFSDTNTTIPAVNIKETAGNYEVEVLPPGITKKNFKFKLNGISLKIISKKRSKKKKKDANRYSRKNLVIN